MLTLGKVDAGGVAYYEGRAPDPGQLPLGDDGDSDGPVPGADGYVGYVAGRHDSEGSSGDVRAGRWVGDLAGRLGLAGEVERGELSALLEGRDPVSGEALGRRVVDRRREGPAGREQRLLARAAWDLQWAPPKSVSALWALGDGRVAGGVEAALDAAVDAGLGYLQDHAVFSRVGAGGAERVRAAGLVGAAYRHETSRSGDPQCHVHVVVANVTEARGRWLRLDGHALMVHRLAADRVFQAELRAELTERLGVGWVSGRTEGTFEVAGVSRAVIDELSRRRAEILERVGARASAAAREAAALDSRQPKGEGRDVEELRGEWRARAAQHGLGREEVVALEDRALRLAVGPPVESFDRLAGERGLTRQRSVFDHRHVVSELAAAARAGVRYRELEEHARRFLAREGVELVEAAEAPGRRMLAVGDRYSTVELLELERSLLARAEAGRCAGVARASDEDVEAVLAGRPELEGEQADMVRRLTRSGWAVDVVRAAPGTGKTFALDAAREAWQRSGFAVYGTALSARAAAELEAGAGVPSATIARLRIDVEAGEGLAAGSVLIVDEAGMVGTRDFCWLADQVERAGGKLVAVGDTRQLPEIEAGGALRALGDQAGGASLSEIRRQEQEWDREAVRSFHQGDASRWLSAQVEHGRVTVAASAPAARRAIVAGWWADAQAHGLDQTVMQADRRETTRELNALAREQMRDAGRLAGQEVRVAGREFAAGDRVLALRNHRGLGVRNGDRGIVLEVGDDGALEVRLDRDADRPRRLGGEYLAAGHVDHAYATTVHKLQGATVQTVHYLGGEYTYGEAALTAMSRHRSSARLYVVDPDLAGAAEIDVSDAGWRRDLERQLGRSRAKQLAVEVQRRAGEIQTGSSEQLRGEEESLRSRAAPYPAEAWRAPDARQRAEQTSVAAGAARERAGREQGPRAEQAAAQLEELAHIRRAEADRLEALDQDWTENSGAATVDAMARRAELERRAVLENAVKPILARHDSVLRGPLEEHLGPRPEGIAGREQWDDLASRMLDDPIAGDLPEPPVPEPPGPDLGPDIA